MLRFLGAFLLLPPLFGALAYVHACIVTGIVMPLIALFTDQEANLALMFLVAPWVAGIQVLATFGAVAKFLIPGDAGLRFFVLAFGKATLLVNTLAIGLFWLTVAVFHPRQTILVAVGFVLVAQILFAPFFRAALLSTPMEDSE